MIKFSACGGQTVPNHKKSPKPSDFGFSTNSRVKITVIIVKIAPKARNFLRHINRAEGAKKLGKF